MKTYPRIQNTDTRHIVEVLQYVSRERDADIAEWNNLSNVFMSGRKVGKVPTSSTDVAAPDRIGDFNYSASYLYLAVDNAGSLAWRRIALASW